MKIKDTCTNRNNTASSVDTECDPSKGCEYLTSTTSVVEKESCKCGKNKNGNSYCELANGNLFKKFLN
jgi:hypothetical protein